MIWLLACQGPDDVADAVFDAPHAVIATAATDYSVGALAVIGLDDLVVHNDVAPTSGDPAVSVDGGAVVQLNRYNYDTLRVYAPGDYRAPTAELQLPDRSNPYETAFCAGRAFTALYDTDYVVVHDPVGWAEAGRVDLSAFADGDDVGPEAASVLAWDGALYVAMQRQQRHLDWAVAEGTVARVDCDTLAVTASWSMGKNLRLTRDADGAPIAFGEPSGDAPGGLWRFDPAPTLLYASTGRVVDGAAILGDVAVLSTHDPVSWEATIGCVDLPTGAWTPGEDTAAYVVGLAADPQGRAWALKRSGWLAPDDNPAEIAVWDPVACAEVASRTTTLEPFAIGFVP